MCFKPSLDIYLLKRFRGFNIFKDLIFSLKVDILYTFTTTNLITYTSFFYQNKSSFYEN
ncbi:hypothetical protein SAMN05660313_00467 [Cellulophaga fucicola]|uniref:Uncharacterized protein n=1 Tax=Cellulophaga fucicola TaxID=76595 RepID=A0A1K1MAL4_9FLAO|nr:hypothetical protein SAMN05660313_00467 [Cellulophaga fucicola]